MDKELKEAFERTEKKITEVLEETRSQLKAAEVDLKLIESGPAERLRMWLGARIFFNMLPVEDLASFGSFDMDATIRARAKTALTCASIFMDTLAAKGKSKKRVGNDARYAINKVMPGIGEKLEVPPYVYQGYKLVTWDQAPHVGASISFEVVVYFKDGATKRPAAASQEVKGKIVRTNEPHYKVCDLICGALLKGA